MAVEIDPSGLRAARGEVRTATAAQILAQQRIIVEEALAVLRSGKEELTFDDARLNAMQVLAAFRAPEAVSSLVRMIDLKADIIFLDETRQSTIGDHYPAAGALVKIGKPAVGPSLWELTKDCPSERRKRLCWIIGAIEGREVGRFIIEKEIPKLEDEARKARLRAALPLFDELFPAEVDQKKK